MKLFRFFAVASAVIAFGIAVLGSWVRINGAGMTCPDWPLCNGALVPSLHGGVVLEWTHRLLVFLETFVVIGAIVTGFRERKRVAGVSPVLVALGVIFAVQVGLGGVTIFLANSPLSVMLHWAAAMALLATLTTLALLSIVPPPDRPFRGRNAAPAIWTAAVFAYLTMCVGAYVSSSNYGLACSSFPACGATLLGAGEPQHLQMLHRFVAESFALVALVAAFFAWGGSPRARVFTTLGVALIVLQFGLGVGNVAYGLPTVLREAHAANAVATFLAFVIAADLASLDSYDATSRALLHNLGSRSAYRSS